MVFVLSFQKFKVGFDRAKLHGKFKIKKYVCKNKAKLKIVFCEWFFIVEKSNYNTQTII